MFYCLPFILTDPPHGPHVLCICVCGVYNTGVCSCECVHVYIHMHSGRPKLNGRHLYFLRQGLY